MTALSIALVGRGSVANDGTGDSARDGALKLNKNVRLLEALAKRAVISATTTAQPVSPTVGDLYIIPSGKTGTDWSAYTNGSLALYCESDGANAWFEITPREGQRFLARDSDTLYRYTGSAWTSDFGPVTKAIAAGSTEGRSLAARFADVANVKDFGAVPDNSTDNLAAFQAALDAAGLVIVPPGNYVLNGALQLNDRNILSGLSPNINGDTEESGSSSARLVFTHTGDACFKAKDTATTLLYAGMNNLTIRVENAATWVWDFKTLVCYKMAFVRAHAEHTTTGGFRSTKISPSDNSWVAAWTDVQIRIQDASAARTIDTDMGDCAFMGSSATGGVGAILRGTAGMRLIGGRYDRSTGYCITISNETESRSLHQIIGCEIEEGDAGGILITGDANDSLTETFCSPIISSCYFRNPGATQGDVVFTNASGGVLKGGVIGPNTHAEAGVTPIAYDLTRWKDVTILPSAHEDAGGVRHYVGTKFRQSGLVLAQDAPNASHTGNTSQTTLATVTIPGNAMGPGGHLQIITVWEMSGSAGTHSARVKFGGTEFTAIALSAANTSARLLTEVYNLSATSQYGPLAGFIGIGQAAGSAVTASVDTTADVTLLITAQLANGADTMTLKAYRVVVYPST